MKTTKEYFTFKEHVSLCNWVGTQRDCFRRNILSQERIDKLNSIGFVWSLKTPGWEEIFKKLLSFKEKHGHVNVSKLSGKEATTFSHWISSQRTNFKNNRLSQERIDKLNSIGFAWNVQADNWHEKFKELLIFKEKYGHTAPAQPSSQPSSLQRGKLRTPDEKKRLLLAYWVNHQRAYFRNNTLSQERIDKLNSIGFEWNPRED